MVPRSRLSAALVATLAAAAPHAHAQCDYSWQEGFAYTINEGTFRTAEVLDVGGEARLYVGGSIDSIGGFGVSDFASWDGSAWQPHPGPAVGAFSGEIPSVRDLLTWDDGTGPALYAGGTWDTIGGATSVSVARWNGGAWQSLGSGVLFNGFDTGIVSALATFDDGTGEALYAAGSFNEAGGVAAENIAKWDGATWTPLGAGISGFVSALAVYDDGSGPALYAAGSFGSAGGNAVGNIAKWNGTTWSSVGTGIGSGTLTLTVYDDGNGDALFAGGSFLEAGGASAPRIARWDGASWSDVAGGLDGTVRTLRVMPSVTGPVLYVGGNFSMAGTEAADNIAQWDGLAWRQVGNGTNGGVFDLTYFEDDSGEPLHAVGAFGLAGNDTLASKIARKSLSGTWQPLFEGDGFDNQIRAMKVWDDGNGPALYIGGAFTSVGGTSASRIVKYDGQTFTPVGGGVNGTVYSIEVFDDGNGEQLYVGGFFTQAGGTSADRIARWDGVSWSALPGGGANGAVYKLYAWDGLGGNALYAGGAFDEVGASLTSRYIARWDGAAWSSMAGLAGGSNPGVRTMVGWDEGDGPHLYAGGHFYSASAIQTGGHAKWDGATWSAIPARWSGNGLQIQDMFVWDDGNGEALYYTGNFSFIGPIAAEGAARYDGTLWLPLSFGVNAGYKYFTWDADDGEGEQLYLGGIFSTAGETPANNVASWNGTDWTALGDGVGGVVYAFEAFDYGVGTGESLFVGGTFLTAGGKLSARFAEWQRACDVGNYCDTSPNSAGPGALIGVTGTTSVAANDFTLTATGAPPSQFGLFYYGPQAENLPFGDGIRCVGGQTFRLIPAQLTDGAGSLARLVDFTQPPASSGAGLIAAGGTWYFQFWYRDPFGPGGSGFNLSDGLVATFEP